MKKILLGITGILVTVALAATLAWAGPPPLTPEIIRDPPDLQRFDPESPGLRIKLNREKVDEYRRVPPPESAPKSETGKPGEGGKKDEKSGR